MSSGNYIMLRHLKNFNELCLYASISCGLAFFTRLNPAYFFPIMLLRIAILVYAFFVIGKVEKNRIFGWCLGAAVLLGLLGGYWDVIELNIVHNQAKIVNAIALFLGFLGIGYLVFSQYKGR